MGQVRYSEDAIADLLALREYIALNNPTAAARVAARIRRSVDRLATHPKFGKVGRVEGTRELVSARFPYTRIGPRPRNLRDCKSRNDFEPSEKAQTFRRYCNRRKIITANIVLLIDGLSGVMRTLFTEQL